MRESLFILQPQLSRSGDVRTALNLAGEFQRRGRPVTLAGGRVPSADPLSHFPRREDLSVGVERPHRLGSSSPISWP